MLTVEKLGNIVLGAAERQATEAHDGLRAGVFRAAAHAATAAAARLGLERPVHLGAGRLEQLDVAGAHVLVVLLHGALEVVRVLQLDVRLAAGPTLAGQDHADPGRAAADRDI